MTQNEDLERSVLKWGGLAGILGGIVFLFVPIVLFGFVPSTPTDPSAVVARFPSVSIAITVGNNIDFVADILNLALLLAVYRALRRTSLPPALFGTAMSILGLAVLFTETQTQVAFAPISNLYHQTGTTTAQQQVLGYIWQATQGMFFELDVAAGLLLSLGFVLIGIAMIRSSGFGKRVGALSAILAAVATLGIALIPVLGEASVVPASLALPVFVVLPILWGWKLYRISETQ